MANYKKTSVNIFAPLAEEYQNSGSNMKESVLSIPPDFTKGKELSQLCRKFGVKIDDELQNVLFPNFAAKNKRNNIKIHLSETDENIINHLSQKDNFSKKFYQLLLIHYAQHIDLEKLCRQINSHYLQTVNPFVQTPEKPKTIFDTGISVHGNKQWFLAEFRKILSAIPVNFTTAIDPFAGSGCITYELCKQNRFKRIIANDVTWQKSNYIRALCQKTKELKNACLSLTPDQNTYDKAKEMAKNNPEPPNNIKTADIDTIDTKSAALYHLKSYCETARGQLRKNVLNNNNDVGVKTINKFAPIPIVP